MESRGVCKVFLNGAEFFLKKWSLLHMLIRELDLINSIPAT